MPSGKPGTPSTLSMLMSWPPGTPPVSTMVFQPRRAAVSAAVIPAMPPPMIATSTFLAIHRHSIATRPRGLQTNHAASLVGLDQSRKPSTPLVDQDGGVLLVEGARATAGVAAAKHLER